MNKMISQTLCQPVMNEIFDFKVFGQIYNGAPLEI